MTSLSFARRARKGVYREIRPLEMSLALSPTEVAALLDLPERQVSFEIVVTVHARGDDEIERAILGQRRSTGPIRVRRYWADSWRGSLRANRDARRP